MYIYIHAYLGRSYEKRSKAWEDHMKKGQRGSEAVIRRKTDNVIPNISKTKDETTNKTLHRKYKIQQHTALRTKCELVGSGIIDTSVNLWALE